MKNSIVIISLLCLTLWQCNKEENQENSTAPNLVVELQSPNEDTQQLMGGDTIQLKAHFSDKDELHNYFALVFNQSTKDTLFYKAGHVHSQEHHFNQDITLMVSEHSNLLFKVGASNHNQESAFDEIVLHVHPMHHQNH